MISEDGFNIAGRGIVLSGPGLIVGRRVPRVIPPWLAPVLDTNPDQVWAFNPSFTYQDEAATVRAHVGDPVGGVRSAETNAVIATESVEAARPTLDSDGAEYGGTHTLAHPASADRYNYVTETAVATVSARVIRSVSGANHAILGNAIGGPDRGFLFRVASTDRVQVLLNDGSGFVTASSPSVHTLTAALTLVTAVLSPTHVQFYIDGAADGAAVAWSPSTGAGDAARNLGVGSIGSSTSHRWEGIIQHAAIWDRGLSSAEVASL
jgi:hypothetical protein